MKKSKSVRKYITNGKLSNVFISKISKSISFIESLFEKTFDFLDDIKVNIRKLKIEIYALHGKINKSNCESKPDILI